MGAKGWLNRIVSDVGDPFRTAPAAGVVWTALRTSPCGGAVGVVPPAGAPKEGGAAARESRPAKPVSGVIAYSRRDSRRSMWGRLRVGRGRAVQRGRLMGGDHSRGRLSRGDSSRLSRPSGRAGPPRSEDIPCGPADHDDRPGASAGMGLRGPTPAEPRGRVVVDRGFEVRPGPPGPPTGGRRRGVERSREGDEAWSSPNTWGEDDLRRGGGMPRGARRQPGSIRRPRGPWATDVPRPVVGIRAVIRSPDIWSLGPEPPPRGRR